MVLKFCRTLALVLPVLLFTGCGRGRLSTDTTYSACGVSATQSIQLNQVGLQGCTSSAAPRPISTGYPASTGQTLAHSTISTAPTPGSRAVATANGYTYEQSPSIPHNPYAGAYFPSANYGTGYASTPSYGTGYGTTPSYGTGYGSTPSYSTGYASTPSYGTGYGTTPSYGTGYIQYNVQQAQSSRARR